MFSVLLISQIETIYDGKAKSVVLPGEAGEFEVLDFHHNIVSLLREGNVVIDGNFYPIKKGVAKFYSEELVALVER